MQHELPIRWIQREVQEENGLTAKNKWYLQMKVMVVTPTKIITGDAPQAPEAVWLDVPFVKEVPDGS
jgi:hypothetical protein